jgi:uncharacterized repeat protein (TIGR03803 family)
MVAPRLKTLYSFTGGSDGGIVSGGVIDKSGMLYGTTYVGGTGPCTFFGSPGCGTIYELSPPASPGAVWTETVLYSFGSNVGNDGAGPSSRLVIDKNGLIYGTTPYSTSGLSSSLGTVYEVTPPKSPSGSWTEAVLHVFMGSPDGEYPGSGALVIGKNGVLYGTTQLGGVDNACSSGCGTVFSLTPPASLTGEWTETVLYRFTGGSDGYGPIGGVIYSGGVLYGTTDEGGTSGRGTVFKLAPPTSPGGAWTETVLYSFGNNGGNDGASPFSSLVIDKNGVLYGTTYVGGSSDLGTVYGLAPPASPSGSWTETVIHSFVGSPDGQYPLAALLIGENGTLYGSTSYGGRSAASCGPYDCGTIFKLTPPTSPGGAWIETILYGFMGGRDGGNPFGGVVIGKSGVLYGVANGGTPGWGTVFALER